MPGGSKLIPLGADFIVRDRPVDYKPPLDLQYGLGVHQDGDHQERPGLEAGLCRVYQTGPPALTASPYYDYCHDKGLAPPPFKVLQSQKYRSSRHPEKIIADFSTDFLTARPCGGGERRRRSRIMEKSGIIFRFVPAALLLSCRSSWLSPLLSSSLLLLPRALST